MIANLKSAKVENFKVRIQGGYELHSGWAIQGDSGYFSSNGIIPHFFRSKKLAQQVADGGINDGALFV